MGLMIRVLPLIRIELDKLLLKLDLLRVLMQSCHSLTFVVFVVDVLLKHVNELLTSFVSQCVG